MITGTELLHLSDPEVIGQLPSLHVFGQVVPEDKPRSARLMQESGEVVAMTGDAVHNAAALKQADIGVAMRSGSEVSKQAAKIVLTDDNFATLVRAADLGRDRPALPMLPGNSVRPGAAVPGLPWANSQVTSTCLVRALYGICHSNATQSKEVLGSIFEKRS